jgi:hypothetical protein
MKLAKYRWTLWVLAFLITAASAVYQRRTGPTHPISGEVAVGGAAVAYTLPRSHGGAGDEEIRLAVPEDVTGTLRLRRYRSHDQWTERPMTRNAQGELVGAIPHQPPAGKVMYQVRLREADGHPVDLTEEPVIIRFRGHVPEPVLLAHILIIFSGMLLATGNGLQALTGNERLIGTTIATMACLSVGGLILGPVVQKYAFDAYWTGWPFGRDLTDNKLAVAVVFWVLALWRGWGHPKRRRGWVLTASFVTLCVWLIPHSMLGSELNYMEEPPQ